MILNRTPLELDEKAFKKLNKLLTKTQEQALAIAEKARSATTTRARTCSRPSSPYCTSSAPFNAKGPADGGAPCGVSVLRRD